MSTIHTQTTSGETVELPAGILFDVMEKGAVRGVYRITMGQNDSFKSIKKVRSI